MLKEHIKNTKKVDFYWSKSFNNNGISKLFICTVFMFCKTTD